MKKTVGLIQLEKGTDIEGFKVPENCELVQSDKEGVYWVIR